MIIGRYYHSLDGKGRLIIPTRLREQLGEKFIVTTGLDGCLFAFPNAEWEKMAEKLQSLPLTSLEARMFVRVFFSDATEVELDKQGRILLSQHLREEAKLDKDLVLSGAGNRLEIWDRACWEEYSSGRDMEKLAEKMSALGMI